MNHFLKARREAILAGILWFVFATWTIGACYVLGYLPEKVTLIWGIPSWVLWGVLTPWIVATVVNSLFAFVIMADDE